MNFRNGLRPDKIPTRELLLCMGEYLCVVWGRKMSFVLLYIAQYTSFNDTITEGF